MTTNAVQQSVRVLVVDDSSLQRNMLIGMLQADAGIEVVGWASNGEEAIVAVERLKPDLVTMDLRMPIMDGLTASERIMREHPTPILMVTGSVSRSNQGMITQALKAGVLGILAKPSATSPTAGDEFVRMVKGLAQVRVRGRRRTDSILKNQSSFTLQPRATIIQAVSPQLERVRVIGIAASTGGPPVLQTILTQLPSDFEIPVLIVQHIASGFARSLVDWLSPLCNIPVQLAVPGTPLTAGIFIASDTHLTLRKGMLSSSLEPAVSGHKPSATVLFRSLAQEFGAHALGVVLTGMGNDGAAGLADLKQAGGMVIAQDKTSSVIHSMPASAIALGISDAILNPEEIASTLAKLKLEKRNFGS